MKVRPKTFMRMQPVDMAASDEADPTIRGHQCITHCIQTPPWQSSNGKRQRTMCTLAYPQSGTEIVRVEIEYHAILTAVYPSQEWSQMQGEPYIVCMLSTRSTQKGICMHINVEFLIRRHFGQHSRKAKQKRGATARSTSTSRFRLESPIAPPTSQS